jgi:hypothetical protein
VRLEVKRGGTHGDACNYLPELEAAALWLERDAWNPSSGSKASAEELPQ